MIGETLARFRVTARLGAGGMGEVYRATDEKLGREVAIKVLPEEVAHDPERLARFEREAQLLASLNHPNIAAIHGLEEAAGKPFLVLELVDGEDLADRMRRGPLPVDDTLEIAAQIAEALAEAHERGIVHRDLKPANVKITPDGKVKVLDFGLAKAYAAETGEASAPDRSQSPTLTAQATQAGMILGTAAYMAPEQARGRPVDRRADVWAFGVVLFEMLTGRRLFEGETVSDVLAAVLKTELDWSSLPSDLPAPLRRLLRRCLERDPRRRLHSAADARLEIDEALSGGGAEPATPRVVERRSTDRRPWILAALLAATCLALVAREVLRPDAATATTRLTIQVTDEEPLASLFGANAVLSPDGRAISYVATSATDTRLHVRRLDQAGARALPGTDGARAPFFSPDGRWIGFGSPAGLMRVGVDGGAPVRIAPPVGNQGRGASWGGDRIAFAPSFDSGLSLVGADGGAPETLTQLDTSRDERSHRWPYFLPGGRAVLFMVQRTGEDYDDADIEAVSLDDGRRRLLVEGGAFPRFVAPDLLLFARTGMLYAVRFDPTALTVSGPPKPVIEDLATWTGDQETGDGSAELSLSAQGDLLYRRTAGDRSTTSSTRFVWVDGAGHEQPAFEVPFRVLTLSLSPDAKHLLLEGRTGQGRGVFIRDMERGSVAPLTTEGAGESSAVWSADGRSIAYMPRRSGQARNVTIRTIDGSAPPRVVPTVGSSGPKAWTPDGSALVVGAFGAETQDDIWRLPVDGGEPRPLVATPRIDRGGDISPDGRWLAYYSEEKGAGNVFVTPLETPGPRWQASFMIAGQPRWSSDGRLLYFATIGASVGDQPQQSEILAVPVQDAGGGPRFGEPRSVFRGFIRASAADQVYDVHPDGRLLVVKLESQDVGIDRSLAVLVLGWRAELQRQMEDAAR